MEPGRAVVSLFDGRLVGICQRLASFDAVDGDEAAELLMIEGDRLTCVATSGRRHPL